MTLREWLEKIQKIHPLKWDLGIERVGRVAARLGVLKPAKTVFLVAGTNGKGSTCEYLAEICMAAGLTCGKATSPFMFSYNEQIVINGRSCADQMIVESFERIDFARHDDTLTYFEFGTLAALDIFSQQKLDVVILEVGLGGRLDAMNIVDPDISIITKIDLDHQNYLGTSRELIALEKAGIMRKDKPCILVDPDPPLSLYDEGKRLGSPLYRLGREFCHSEGKFQNQEVQYRISACQLPLPSALAAIQGCLLADIELSQDLLDQTLPKVHLAGRFQQLFLPQRVILDVAHNPNAAAFLSERLKALNLGKSTSVSAIIGMYADKDIAGVLKVMAPHIDSFYFSDLDSERAASALELARQLSDCVGLMGSTYAKVSEAFAAALSESEPEDVVLVFGSFPVVTAVLRHLGMDFHTTGAAGRKQVKQI